MWNLFRKIMFYILLNCILAGSLFSADYPTVEGKKFMFFSQKIVDLQSVYNELTETTPAVILLRPEGTTGVSADVIESVYTEIVISFLYFYSLLVRKRSLDEIKFPRLLFNKSPAGNFKGTNCQSSLSFNPVFH